MSFNKAVLVPALSFIIVLSLLFLPASHALKISSITFNVTNTTYGQYNMISLLVKGNQTGYNIAIQTFNLTIPTINISHVLNDTTTRINITKLIGAGKMYNLTLNISNSTLAGTPLKYNLTRPAYFNVSKAALTLSLSASLANFTYNGTAEKFTTGVFSTVNNQITATLYKETVNKGTTTGSSISYSNATSAVYNIWFNASSNANYTVTNAHSARKITPATLSQTLKAFPSASFTYDGLPPIMQDTLNASILPGNSLSFNLVNNSVTAVSTSSSFEPFIFTILPGKYAAVGSYSYTSSSSGNINYSVITSPSVTVTINKATPALTVTGKLGNFTYNGTKDNISGQVVSNFLDVIKTIGVQINPEGVAITPNGQEAYVANEVSNTVSVINTSSFAVITTITVRSDPIEVVITPNGRFAYVTNEDNNTVSVINTSSYAVIKNITVQTNPKGVAITPNGQEAYVANYGSNTVSVINTSSYKVIENVTGQSSPEAVAITPNGQKAYVANAGSSTVSVINTSSFMVITTINVQSTPIGVAITPNGQEAYVVNLGSSTVSVINTSSYAVIKNITVQSTPEAVAITPNGQEAYVPNYGSNTVSVINTSSYAVIKNVTVQTNPEGVAITPNGQEAYVANYGFNTVSVINAFKTPTITASLYINGRNISATKTRTNYLNATAGTYVGWFNATSNQNYTATQIKIARNIAKAKLNLSKYFIVTLNVTPSPNASVSNNAGNITYNGLSLSFYNDPFIMVNNQITATLYRDTLYGEALNIGNANNYSIFYKNATAGTYNMWLNATGNANYTVTNAHLIRKISKATINQTLKAFPSDSFVSNGTVPVIQDNLTAVTGAIVSGNLLLFTLNSSFMSVISNSSSTFPNASFNFSALPSSYKYPGSYFFNSSSAGNRNYTVIPSSFLVRITGGGGSTAPVISTNVYNFSLIVDRSGAEADYLVLSPSIYLRASDFHSVNVSFMPNTSNLTFSLFVSGNLSSSVCAVSSVPDPIQGISILPSISETGVISGAKFGFSLGLNNQSKVSGYNLSPNEIVLYKCDVQNDSWIQIPTSYSTGQKSVNYTASSDSLSNYEIGSFALPSNITNRVVTTVLETGLPAGYLYNATYDGSTRSASAPSGMSFNTSAGSYPLTLYALTNSSSNSTANCITTYSTTNFSTGVPKSIAAGSSVTVNYSGSTKCLLVSITPSKAPSRSLSSYLVLLGVITVIVILAVVYLLRKSITSGKRSKHVSKK